ncbi:DUF2155 domain-containing protein [Yoonia sp.]|uniref:DUF2155 domain-containing protein n=1 Tax=Yoonia sp. TaxID=2212373 RepID=UPI0025CC4F76|nr:DUF2155 domain-containing protein [Yoonia sp.]
MRLLKPLLCAVLLATPAAAQDVTTAQGGVVRVLDKLTGAITDLSLRAGEAGGLGYLDVTLNQCRYPTANPSGDAYAEVVVRYRDAPEPVFAGWILASSPALHAMDHPRYDVWVLRCMTS